jgi:hypothetical protein
MRDKLSAILRYNLPEFVREDHELFIAFVQAYYEWMEESGNALYFLQGFEKNLDVDLAEPEFIDQFIKELAVTFPKNILISRDELLKIIREFYISKGSEQSFRFLFTILYDAEIEIQEPREFIHKSSTGQYQSNDYAYITADNEFKIAQILRESPENISASIEGVTSGAKAIIDLFTTTFFDQQKIFKMDISSYQGFFTPGEDVLLTVNEFLVQEKIYGIINDIQVTDGGTNYKLTDSVTITDATGKRAKAKIKRLDSGGFDSVTILAPGTGYAVGEYIGAVPLLDSQGYGFLAQIKEVDTGGEILAVQVLNQGYDYTKLAPGFVKNSAGTGAQLELNGDRIGKIIEMEVFDSGINYENVGTINVTINSTDGVGAVLTPILRGVFNEPKVYINQDDFPSNYDRILDSYLYQDFSYVIQSKVAPQEWLGTVKRIAHPAGMQLFGSLLLENVFDIHITLPDNVAASISYTIKLLNQVDVPNHPIYESRQITLIRENDDSCGMGLTLWDLDVMKFYPSFPYPIEPFKDYTIDDVVSRCQPPMKYMESSTITII